MIENALTINLINLHMLMIKILTIWRIWTLWIQQSILKVCIMNLIRFFYYKGSRCCEIQFCLNLFSCNLAHVSTDLSDRWSYSRILIAVISLTIISYSRMYAYIPVTRLYLETEFAPYLAFIARKLFMLEWKTFSFRFSA